MMVEERSLSAGRVLVVDDESDLRECVSLVLREAGFEVAVAADGLEGIEKIDTLHPALVVLDLMMPKMDGWGVLRALQARAGAPAVVMLSAAADPRRAAREGAQACLAKPFHNKALVEVCRRVLAARLREDRGA